MGLVVVSLALAVALGAATGGRLSALRDLTWRGTGAMAGALCFEIASALLGGPLGIPLALVGLLLAGWAVTLNLRLPGLLLVGAGLVLNTAAILANGAMPVSLTAAERSGMATGDLRAGFDAGHEVATTATHLRAVTDIVPVALPWRPEVVSIGDVLVASGVALCVFAAMRGGRTRTRCSHAARRAAPRPVAPTGPRVS